MTTQLPTHRLAGRAVLVGLPGVLLLPWVVPAPAGVPPAALLLNGALPLLVLAAVGAWAVPRLGLRSRLLLGDPVAARAIGVSLALGAALGAGIALADHALAPSWRPTGVATLREGRTLATLALGVLYGGFTEEIVMRWGLLAGLAAGLVRWTPRPVALGVAVAVSSVLFAAAHLPAVLAEAGLLPTAPDGVAPPVPPGLVARTLGWNTLVGLLFGTAFVRRGLEVGIGLHVGFHVGVAAVAL